MIWILTLGVCAVLLWITVAGFGKGGFLSSGRSRHYGSGIGASLHELNAIARPSNRHVIEVMQTRPELREEEPGGDGVKVVFPPAPDQTKRQP